ncbi:unnamed protein product [Caretta caretta]
MLGASVRRFATSAIRRSHYEEGPGKQHSVFCRKQMAATRINGSVLRKWVCCSFRHSKAPTAQEMKRTSFNSYKKDKEMKVQTGQMIHPVSFRTSVKELRRTQKPCPSSLGCSILNNAQKMDISSCLEQYSIAFK